MGAEETISLTSCCLPHHRPRQVLKEAQKTPTNTRLRSSSSWHCKLVATHPPENRFRTLHLTLPALGTAANRDIMGFLGRRSRNGPSPVAKEKRARGRQTAAPYTMATRPSFGQWLKATWLDLLTMVILGAVGLGVRRCSVLLAPPQTNDEPSRFTSPSQRPPGRSPSSSPMARSSTPRLPTLSARTSSPSGSPPSSPP